MAEPLEIMALDNGDGIRGYGGMGNDFLIRVEVHELGIELGRVAIGTNTYTHGTELNRSHAISLFFENVTDPPDIAIGDYLVMEISHPLPSKALRIYFNEARLTPGRLYLDTKGRLYTDSTLETPFDEDKYWVSFEDSIASSDSQVEDEEVASAAYESLLLRENYVVEEDISLSIEEELFLAEIQGSEDNQWVSEGLLFEEESEFNPYLEEQTLHLKLQEAYDAREGNTETKETINLVEDGSLPSLMVDELIFIQPNQKGFIEISDGAESIIAEEFQYFNLVTDAIDMGMRALKFLESVELGNAEPGITQVAIDYKYERDTEWSRTEWKPVNKEGIAWVKIAGVEFRIAIRSTSLISSKPDYITLHWKAIDKRGVRGIYVQAD